MSTLSTYVLTSNIKQMDYTEIISIFYSKNKYFSEQIGIIPKVYIE